MSDATFHGRPERAVALAASLFAAACGPPAPDARSLDSPAGGTVGVDAAAVLSNVALLLVDRPDGRTGYGTGVLLDDRGLVLTNRHVIAPGSACRALLFDPDRPTYTPLDGGITRLIEENGGAAIPCDPLCDDAEVDLAVVRLRVDSLESRPVELRAAPALVGEAVIAVGHPEEAVWSITRGVVSAVRATAIQHDAAVSTGSSGGPLLDAEGRLLGINTLEARGPRGFGFARPLSMSESVLACAAGR